MTLKCSGCGEAVSDGASSHDLCPRCLARGLTGRVAVGDSMPAGDRSMGALALRLDSQGADHTLVLKGELDTGSAAMLEEAVSDLCSGRAVGITLDMGAVEFVDSTGFRAIFRAKALCEQCGCTLSLTATRQPVEHVFKLAGVIDRLPFRKKPEATAAPDARRATK